MKKLVLTSAENDKNRDFIESNLLSSCTKKEFISNCEHFLVGLTIEFYDYVGMILRHIGFVNPHVTREGDTNCRMDAIIIDNVNSIPIEIKSPREVMEINVKSIRQAFENKVVILSRKFYHSRENTTSLVVAFNYPAERSDVYELISDIYNAFDFCIGLINVGDLLSLVYDVRKNNKKLNFDYFNSFVGRFNYEKAFIK